MIHFRKKNHIFKIKRFSSEGHLTKMYSKWIEIYSKCQSNDEGLKFIVFRSRFIILMVNPGYISNRFWAFISHLDHLNFHLFRIHFLVSVLLKRHLFILNKLFELCASLKSQNTSLNVLFMEFVIRCKSKVYTSRI